MSCKTSTVKEQKGLDEDPTGKCIELEVLKQRQTFILGEVK